MSVHYIFKLFSPYHPLQIYVVGLTQWRGAADAEIKNPTAENPKLSKLPSVKPGVGQNTGSHASAAARNSIFLISAFPVLSTSFSSQSSSNLT